MKVLKPLIPLFFLSACMGLADQNAHSLAVPGAGLPNTDAPANAMPKGSPALAPRQYKEYCARTPEDCKIPHSAEVTAAIAETMHMTHLMVRPAPEEGDSWQALTEPGAGDCEDFALTMRKHLRAQFPEYAAAFLMATAYTETQQYHAVLTVETDRGTLVCDIRYSECGVWDRFPYQWRLREVAGSSEWQELGPYREVVSEAPAAPVTATPDPAHEAGA